MNVHASTRLRQEIQSYNDRLGTECRRRGVSLRTYKLVKAVSQLAGIAAGVYAMSLGADPLTAFALIALIYVGPEAFEQILLNGGDTE